jgi:hypothetical protein
MLWLRTIKGIQAIAHIKEVDLLLAQLVLGKQVIVALILVEKYSIGSVWTGIF